MPKRLRLRLRVTAPIMRATYNTRPSEYLRLRHWWLGELRNLRAKRRVHGMDVRSETKVMQRELVRIRKVHK